MSNVPSSAPEAPASFASFEKQGSLLWAYIQKNLQKIPDFGGYGHAKGKLKSGKTASERYVNVEKFFDEHADKNVCMYWSREFNSRGDFFIVTRDGKQAMVSPRHGNIHFSDASGEVANLYFAADDQGNFSIENVERINAGVKEKGEKAKGTGEKVDDIISNSPRPGTQFTDTERDTALSQIETVFAEYLEQA